MSAEPKAMKVHILDKEYLVACPDGERDALINAAQHLDRAMRQVRDSGKVFGTERIAVITGLNLTHELLQKCQESDQYSAAVDSSLQRMRDKIQMALQGDNDR